MRFIVTHYYSGFFQTEVEADSEDEAMGLDIDIDYNEVASNLEPMPELDHAEPETDMECLERLNIPLI